MFRELFTKSQLNEVDLNDENFSKIARELKKVTKSKKGFEFGITHGKKLKGAYYYSLTATEKGSGKTEDFGETYKLSINIGLLPFEEKSTQTWYTEGLSGFTKSRFSTGTPSKDQSKVKFSSVQELSKWIDTAMKTFKSDVKKTRKAMKKGH